MRLESGTTEGPKKGVLQIGVIFVLFFFFSFFSSLSLQVAFNPDHTTHSSTLKLEQVAFMRNLGVKA
jgi:hypothetical protein